jgi:hypothetical protein
MSDKVGKDSPWLSMETVSNAWNSFKNADTFKDSYDRPKTQEEIDRLKARAPDLEKARALKKALTGE